MSIQINNFLGRFGWNMRKYFPNISSSAYLTLQFITRRREQKQYCDYFLNAKDTPKPNVVNIETINRCNSNCAFCTANVQAERRPLAKIDDALYRSIIDQLADWGYEGHLTLYGNNEPLLDPRIVEFHRYAREMLPRSFIFMSTNGKMLTREKLDEIKPYVDQIIINNYCEDMKLHRNIREIYDYVKAHPSDYEDVQILIQMRYVNEVLTNRAGSAPNKQTPNKVYKETCLLPFTDVWIMPNGKMGLCCCDNYETTDFADLTKVSIKDGWSSPALNEVRRLIASGRNNYPFCRHCDFIDAGFRMQLIKAILKGDQERANRIGGEEKMKRKGR